MPLNCGEILYFRSFLKLENLYFIFAFCYLIETESLKNRRRER